jgi:hypothetical protein
MWVLAGAVNNVAGATLPSGASGHRLPTERRTLFSRRSASGARPRIPSVTDRRIEKWQDWMEHGVAGDVFAMHLQRQTWDRLADMIRANDDLNGSVSYFWEFLFETYSKTQASAVRRQADTHRDSASLGMVVLEMSQTPELLTRDYWLSLWQQRDHDPYWTTEAERQWEANFAGDVGEHLDPAIPVADLATLQAGSERVTRYVDRNVAHLDARTVPRSSGRPEGEAPQAPQRTASDLKLDEVHEAIDLVGSMFITYSGLLTAAAWVDLTPVIQHDWERIFEVPWKPPGPRRQAHRST